MRKKQKKKPEQPGQVKKGRRAGGEGGRRAGGEGGREPVMQDLLGGLRGWDLISN